MPRLTASEETDRRKLMADHKAARKIGVDQRNLRKAARTAPMCSHLDRRIPGEGLCSAPAADPEADIRLCAPHLARVLEPLLPKVYAKMRADILAEVEKALRQEQAA